MGIAVGDAELHEDIDEEGKLSSDVEEKEFLREPPEEGELHGREEGRVHRPEQYELGP